MALPLPMLSVLLSTLFACSLAFRDCKKTRTTVSDQRHTHDTAKRGIHGAWGEVVGRGCVCWCVCEGKRKSEGQKVRVRACVPKLNIAKKGISKKKKKTISKEAWNQQTSRPAQQTAVTPTCKKKKNYRDQTKTAPDTSQHRGDRGQPHIESWLSPETLLGDPSLCLRPRAGLEWTRRFSCTFNIVSLWLHFKNIITGQRKRRGK